MGGIVLLAMAVMGTLASLGGEVGGLDQNQFVRPEFSEKAITDPCLVTASGTDEEKRSKCSTECQNKGESVYGGGCCFNKKDDPDHSAPLVLLGTLIGIAGTELTPYCNCCNKGYKCGTGGAGCVEDLCYGNDCAVHQTECDDETGNCVCTMKACACVEGTDPCCVLTVSRAEFPKCECCPHSNGQTCVGSGEGEGPRWGNSSGVKNGAVSFGTCKCQDEICREANGLCSFCDICAESTNGCVEKICYDGTVCDKENTGNCLCTDAECGQYCSRDDKTGCCAGDRKTCNCCTMGQMCLSGDCRPSTGGKLTEGERKNAEDHE